MSAESYPRDLPSWPASHSRGCRCLLCSAAVETSPESTTPARLLVAASLAQSQLSGLGSSSSVGAPSLSAAGSPLSGAALRARCALFACFVPFPFVASRRAENCESSSSIVFSIPMCCVQCAEHRSVDISGRSGQWRARGSTITAAEKRGTLSLAPCLPSVASGCGLAHPSCLLFSRVLQSEPALGLGARVSPQEALRRLSEVSF